MPSLTTIVLFALATLILTASPGPGVIYVVSRSLAQGRRGEQTAIFCSGGPVSVAVGRALNLSAPDILRVAWMLRNSSHSEFLYSGERFTLSALNAVPHVDDAALVTYW